MTTRVVVDGVGLGLPSTVRSNDDPIFDWIRAHQPPGADLFRGYDLRRVLGPTEDLADLMAEAARAALSDGGTSIDDVDVLIGFGSLGPFAMPNPLALVHQKLGLRPSVPVLPVANDYANFTAGLSLATALIEADRAHRVLVVCGSDWTRHMDYHSPQCIAAGDGAGAAVVRRSEDPTRFAVVDSATITESVLYGAMYLAGDEFIAPRQPNGPFIPGSDHHQFTWPYFHITDRGHDAFLPFGQQRPVEAVTTLLARHHVRPEDVTLIGHQASTVLLDHWTTHIAPRARLDTIAIFGDPPQSNLAMTLAARGSEIETPHLVFIALGVEFSTTATLLSRPS